MTETYTVDGTDLRTYAWNIDTLSGTGRLPAKVGDNVRIPFRHGRTWKAKTYDSRVETLSMWVHGCAADGTVPAAGERATFNANLRALKRLFAPTGRQLHLERTLEFPAGEETHTALAEVTSTIDPIFAGALSAAFTVDLLMADPWWYGSQQATDVTSAGATVTNPGDVEATAMIISLVGPLTNPRLRNASVTPVVDVRYAGTIAAGQTVTLDTDAFTAVDGSGNVVTGKVSHAGALPWMVLEPGANAMQLANYLGGAVGSGKAAVAFRPPYT